MVAAPYLEKLDLEARLWEELSAQGREPLRAMLEASADTELIQRLGGQPYARDPQVQTDYRNGYYPGSFHYPSEGGTVCSNESEGASRVAGQRAQGRRDVAGLAEA